MLTYIQKEGGHQLLNKTIAYYCDNYNHPLFFDSIHTFYLYHLQLNLLSSLSHLVTISTLFSLLPQCTFVALLFNSHTKSSQSLINLPTPATIINFKIIQVIKRRGNFQLFTRLIFYSSLYSISYCTIDIYSFHVLCITDISQQFM